MVAGLNYLKTPLPSGAEVNRNKVNKYHPSTPVNIIKGIKYSPSLRRRVRKKSNNTSSSPNKEGLNTLNPNQVEVSEPEKGNVIKRKDLEV